jgi:formylglycine-generating enzyme required for sulfatase activity
VDAFPASRKGFHDVFGSVWQWCEDHFNALPGASRGPCGHAHSLVCVVCWEPGIGASSEGCVWAVCPVRCAGFKVHPFYEDFSMPCFDGQHHM